MKIRNELVTEFNDAVIYVNGYANYHFYLLDIDTSVQEKKSIHSRIQIVHLSFGAEVGSEQKLKHALLADSNHYS